MSDLSDLELENLFIQLKGEGKELEEIKRLLPSATEEQVLEWEKGYSEEIKKKTLPNFFQTKIIGKKADGSYVWDYRAKINVSLLQYVKFSLGMVIDRVGNEKSTLFKKQAEESLELIEKYVSQIKSLDFDNNDYNMSYEFNTDNEEIRKNVKKALHFYSKTIGLYENFVQQSSLLKEPSTDYYTSYENSKAYALKQFKIQNYKGIKETSISNLPIDAPWIFLTGENGYGKSSILKAIAIGLNGRTDEGQILFEDKEAKISIEFKREGTNYINNIWQSLHTLDELACYGPSRLLVQPSQSKNEIDKKSTKTYSLFNPDGVLLTIENELLIWFLSKDPRFENVKKLFCTIIPYLKDIRIESNRHIRYVEQEIEGEKATYPDVDFDELASGFRSILAMVGDLIIRLFKTQPEIEHPTDLKGLVIIDELDLHWHPKLQRSLPSLLSNAFPKIQFIASTHSVIPILGAPKGSVFLKVNRTVEAGITVEQLDLEVENLLPNTLLTSSLFDMEKISSIANENIDAIHTENTSDELSENEKMREALEQFEAKNQIFPDELYKRQAE